ncbi:MAG: hypothetical protein AB7F31_01815 [Parachlamydiales bacterium]
MKRLLPLLLFPLALFADSFRFESQDPNKGTCCQWDAIVYYAYVFPWHSDAEYLITGRAHIDDPLGGYLSYSQGQVNLRYTLCVDPCSALAVNFGYDWSTFDLTDNPYFHDTGFPELNLSLSGYTRRIPRWLWTGMVGLWWQTTQANLGRYGDYHGILAGRYDWCPNLGFHMGILWIAGKRKGFVRPVIGIDTMIRRKVKLSLVYPTDMAVTYCFTKDTSLAFAAHFLRNRQRAAPNEPVPEAIWEYRSWGFELRLDHHATTRFGVEAYVGCLPAGWVKIYTQLADLLTYRELNVTFYAGAKAFFNF